MEAVAAQPDSALPPSAVDLKRKRTPDEAHPLSAAPPQKTQKTANAHLAINYLARQYTEDLPLISNDDSLPSILHLLGEYQGVLERHESMACNLGARPLGPILIKRFERLFDGPPKVLKNHGKDGNTVTWLDVVEFARNKPEQFTLGQMSEGLRVCQFYTKQCRVQISEEDFVLISSGIPQKMIPPQPIVEDEEKELGTLEILEKNLSSICHLADQVAARTRQLRHRINGRKLAILERRANEPGPSIRGTSPSLLNGGGSSLPAPVQAQAGFIAVNSRHGVDSSGNPVEYSKTGASASTRTELMSKFVTQAEKERRNAERSTFVNGDSRRVSSGATPPSSLAPHIPRPATAGPPKQPQSPLRDLQPRNEQYENSYHYQSGPVQQAPRPVQHERIPSSSSGPSLLTHQSYGQSSNLPPANSPTQPTIKEKENDGPYKVEMVTRMESLKRGDRVLPPCDRCRRLHMDCIKNLTACAGCTKKHAKCSWRDVRESELFGPDANKVPIPAERDREPSVGLRPDHTPTTQNIDLPAASNGNAYSAHDSVVAGMPSARTIALESLQAAGQHAQVYSQQPGLLSGSPSSTPPDTEQHQPQNQHQHQQHQSPPTTAQHLYSHHSHAHPTLQHSLARYDIARVPSPRTDAASPGPPSVPSAAAEHAAADNSLVSVGGERRDGGQTLVH